MTSVGLPGTLPARYTRPPLESRASPHGTQGALFLSRDFSASPGRPGTLGRLLECLCGGGVLNSGARERVARGAGGLPVPAREGRQAWSENSSETNVAYGY